MRRVLAGAALALALTASAAQAAEAVVALQDSGINPYHQVFRNSDPRFLEHPSTYLPGYPANAKPLRLTLTGQKDWAAAVKKDCAVWQTVRRGELYYVPGTRIVGAISFSPQTKISCPAATGRPPILDFNGHGTMVASRAASNAYGGCRECLVVMVQYPANALETEAAYGALDWLGANTSWIDVESHSWGPLLFGAWDPTDRAFLVAGGAGLARRSERNAQRHPAFWASGNGLAGRGGVLGAPGTATAPQIGPSAFAVGGHDSGQVTAWTGFPPHLVSDACASWAAKRDHLTESGDSIGGGTSAATPFVAGGAARMLREARAILGDSSTGVRDGVAARGPAGLVPGGPLADGTFTLAEWRALLLKTATPRPVKQFEDGPACGTGQFGPLPVSWTDVPAQAPEYLLIGYGAVDDPAQALASKVLRGTAALPDRADTDRFFAADGQGRAVTHRVFTLGDPGER